ncbi:hypothetical protein I3843_01G016900 [Carya illinoinensis]|nr:hypothetical protein I3843_01G016900 [Carya illinoinensis]
MSNLSFLNFQYGISIKPPSKPVQSSISKERQCSNTSKCLQLNVEEMRRVFDKFDSNKDGKLSKEEYKLAQRVLLDGGIQVPETEMAKEFQMIDSDGDGFIDFNEFMEVFNIGDSEKVRRSLQPSGLQENGESSRHRWGWFC